MRNNYVLIDWENVQPESMELLDHEHVQVRVFVGAMQMRARGPELFHLSFGTIDC